MSVTLVQIILAVVTVAAAAFSAVRSGLGKTQRELIDSLSDEVDSLKRRLDLTEQRMRMYRNQVRVLLDLIREHKIIGASTAADVIARQIAECEDAPEEPRRRGRRAS